ncbi:MAG TPA: vWA domain-containing protein [Terriglobales bacterium]|nr:vWA domain-containing protein [Terriglobales bacterium]
MNVILRDGKTVTGLSMQNLTGRTKHEAVAIDSLVFDTSPRRILLVLDTGHDLAPDARRAELEIASYLVGGARETDSFALLTARGTLMDVPFKEGRDAVLSGIAKLRDAKAGTRTRRGILDALLEATTWFQDSKPGDAIIVMASEIGTNESAHFSQVANAVAKNGVRLFSIALGPILEGTYFGPTEPLSQHNEGWAFLPNQENLSALTWNNGGYMLMEDTKDARREYKLTDAHLHNLQDEVARMYSAIATFYRVGIRVPPGLKRREPWKLDLSDEIRKKVPAAYVVYPRFLEPCPPVISATGK